MRYDVMKIKIVFWNILSTIDAKKARQNQFSNNYLLIDLLIDLCTQAISSLYRCAIILPSFE